MIAKLLRLEQDLLIGGDKRPIVSMNEEAEGIIIAAPEAVHRGIFASATYHPGKGQMTFSLELDGRERKKKNGGSILPVGSVVAAFIPIEEATSICKSSQVESVG